jgi:WD40 repeat protein
MELLAEGDDTPPQPPPPPPPLPTDRASSIEELQEESPEVSEADGVEEVDGPEQPAERPSAPAHAAQTTPSSSVRTAKPSPSKTARSVRLDCSHLLNCDRPPSLSLHFKPEVRHGLSAHSSTVTAMDTADGAGCSGIFVTSSKDGTVRIWSASAANSLLQCCYTYRSHKEPVVDVCFLGHRSWVASCTTQGPVHLWDSETGVRVTERVHVPLATLTRVDSPTALDPLQPERPAMLSHFSALEPLPQRNALLLGGDLDGRGPCVRVVDVAQKRAGAVWVHPHGATAQASIRAMVASRSGHWVATALSSGYVCVFDERTGILLHHWRAHEGSIGHMEVVGPHTLITTGSDKGVVLWDIAGAHAAPIERFTGNADAVTALYCREDEVVCGVENLVSCIVLTDRPSARMTVTHLKGNRSRSNITAVTSLRDHGLYAMGLESGSVLIV